MKTIAALLLASTAAALTVSIADLKKLDDNPSVIQTQLCHALASAWVFAVPEPYRSNAITMLRSSAIIALTEAQVGALVHERKRQDENFAKRFLSDAIGRLEQRRDDELKHQIGSWTDFDQRTLDELVQLQNERAWSQYSPYLIMAVVGFEHTGGFSAEECGDDLVIGHSSLGRWTPPPSNIPVIVFLDHKPMHIHSEMSVAE